MKVVISIQRDVFESAERFARRIRKSRSQLFSDALREYLARHTAEEITAAMNRVSAERGDPADDFAAAAASRILERAEW
jgi:metal-responsive CopG/Arc/MetJ family transcriptional regulator